MGMAQQISRLACPRADRAGRLPLEPGAVAIGERGGTQDRASATHSIRCLPRDGCVAWQIIRSLGYHPKNGNKMVLVL